MDRERVSSLYLGAVLVVGMLMTGSGCTKEKEAASDEGSLSDGDLLPRRVAYGDSCIFDAQCGNHLKCTGDYRIPSWIQVEEGDSRIQGDNLLECRCKGDACCYSRPDISVREDRIRDIEMKISIEGDVHCYRDFYRNKVVWGYDLQCNGIKEGCDRWACQCFQRMNDTGCTLDECGKMRNLCAVTPDAGNLDIIRQCTTNR